MKFLIFLMIVGCADDSNPPITLLDATPDACIFHDDAEPASECCNLEPAEATECARQMATPGSCISISCFHGCEVEKVQGCCELGPPSCHQ